MKQLPPKFKLYLEGKHVGYMWFDQKLKEIVINYSSDGIFWYSTFLIAFDKMRQLTGFQDTHGKDIAFGDELTIPKSGKKKFTVSLYPRSGIMAVNRNDWWGCGAFNVMELVED